MLSEVLLCGRLRFSMAVTLFSNAVPRTCLPDDGEEGCEEVALEVLAVSDGDQVDLGGPVRVHGERVGVAGRATPRVGVLVVAITRSFWDQS